MLARRRARIVAFFLAFAYATGAAGWTETVRAQEPPAFALKLPKVESSAPVLEFNGKDLSGFYTYLHVSKYADPKGVFTVKDGLLDISGEEFGGLTTREQYHDYVLIAEWKWGDRTFGSRKNNARDSGLLLHCVGSDGAASGN
jgi:hypothetical protein